MSDINLQASSLALQNTQQSKLIETKRDTAMEFERIFAQHLVQELTKGSFDGDDNISFGGSTMKMYRHHITETLAGELAKQQKLGMADMLMDHWNIKDKPSKSTLNPTNSFNLKPNTPKE